MADLGFFNLFFNGKSIDSIPAIEYAGKDTYFRDIFTFINRIYNIARIKNVKEVRDNL